MTTYSPSHFAAVRLDGAPELIGAYRAAPELLEALDALLGTVSDEEKKEHDDMGAPAHDAETCALCMARAALNKADGK